MSWFKWNGECSELNKGVDGLEIHGQCAPLPPQLNNFSILGEMPNGKEVGEKQSRLKYLSKYKPYN